MSRIIRGSLIAHGCRVLPLVAGLLMASCGVNIEPVPPALRPLPKDTMMLLGKKGMDAQAPLFIRIFKEESELEVWKQRDDGRFYHFKTYPICNWSGDLGPKVKQGDRQAPEGFYAASREQMNPDSKFHLAMYLGYPNAFDRSHRRTGEYLMIHGKCKSAGCYAMTDAIIEEIYAMAREAFLGGHDNFQVHAFPFRMSDENMARHAKHEAFPFWRTLKEGYDYFELTRQVPSVAVCSRRYVVNVVLPGGNTAGLNPEAACPAFFRPKPDPFRPKAGEQIADERVVVRGPKMRSLASIESDTPRSGLLSTGSFGAQPAPNMSLAPGR
jgi:murein L,D-transpeptidase YafK